MTEGREELSAVAPAIEGRAVAAQEWRDVAFVHWRVDPDRVRPLLPAGTRPDATPDGASWVGLIAFRLRRARLGALPPIPLFGDFTEVNVRLYATDERGRRGVVFRSLEASSLPAVAAARAAFSLPYFWSRTDQRATPNGWEYAARRRGGRLRSRFRIAVDATEPDDPDALFLTARWGLFQRRRGRTVWLPNAHETWRLRAARLVRLDDDLVAAAGLTGVVESPPSSVLFSPGVSARFGRGSPIG